MPLKKNTRDSLVDCQRNCGSRPSSLGHKDQGFRTFGFVACSRLSVERKEIEMGETGAGVQGDWGRGKSLPPQSNPVHFSSWLNFSFSFHLRAWDGLGGEEGKDGAGAQGACC